MTFEYLRDPAAIYAESFRLAAELADLRAVPDAQRPLALRLVHACGMPEIAADLAFSGDPLARGRAALGAGATILCDARMVEAGIAWDRLPPACRTFCAVQEPDAWRLARELGTTRSAAAVELWRPHLEGAVVAIGNAPTALFHLIERLAEWPERPAAIMAFPVGLVGAAESKAALLDAGLDVPFATLKGRFGGSALAAAAVNALLPAQP